ncbi:hypothetical protein [Embleya scabrispora]|uniref:hypothetical protein n=1 Tax=Embleya scabrispora TaxID=159449 RepID=UPI00037ADE67|nr:hypothetical protein [Embleya scabrispora]MYS80044.1 hypothetical protein [Streptomyces sp. SID5474]
MDDASTAIAVLVTLMATVAVALVVLGLIVFVRRVDPVYWGTFATSVMALTPLLRLRAARRRRGRRF